jgi:hypothetical protein
MLPLHPLLYLPQTVTTPLRSLPNRLAFLVVIGPAFPNPRPVSLPAFLPRPPTLSLPPTTSPELPQILEPRPSPKPRARRPRLVPLPANPFLLQLLPPRSTS